MRKKIACFILFSVYLLLSEKMVARAQTGGGCNDTGKVTYSDGGDWGFNIIIAEKAAPENPVVVTQDDKHRGVDIVVEIVSYPGTITYETEEQVCIGLDQPDNALPKCSPYRKNGLFYHRQAQCITHTETVYRHITGESIKVWLKPTDRTEQWLGWITTPMDEYPLRFMFPEKWSLGTWTPEGFTAEGDTGLWTSAEIDAFIASHPGFNFLKADPRTTDLPSQYLKLAGDPDSNGGGSGRVIPLYGGVAAGGPYASIGYPGQCIIEYSGPGLGGDRGSCTEVVNGVMNFFAGGVSVFDDGITSLIIYIDNVPMDLPGEWYVGVEAGVTPARYGAGKVENYLPENLSRNPANDGYVVKSNEHSFLVYIWLTAPCNAGEEHGCDN
ncbi:MAG: hypothetical protein JW748_03235 [Anaerolineales bacterium]|nr:hypothetical protein [Anaerolineales bacterium]